MGNTVKGFGTYRGRSEAEPIDRIECVDLPASMAELPSGGLGTFIRPAATQVRRGRGSRAIG